MDAFRENDVYDWTPQAPTRFYYCTADDQVVYLNSVVADSVMNANGAADVMAIDVNPAADHGECVPPAMIQCLLFFGTFQELTVGNENIAVSQQIDLSPNPAENFIRTGSIPAGAMIEIFDLNGQLMYKQKARSSQETIDISSLPNGLYLFRATDGIYQYHSRLVKY
ncbi:MAG: T9SS C-terminal target domain-containing protein [Bacteroidetes bacterium]|nr:MAG: T9SS C-terminal target domain-containing protein [Bacteroidota bacterium]